MKLKSSSLCWMLALSGAVLPLARPAAAQNNVTAGAAGRLSIVELRDTSLADALEMVFKAAGNPSHIIDESAKLVPIPTITLNNIAWDAAIRNLANLNNFKVSRNQAGAWVVEPRAPLITDGQMMGEDGMPIPGMGGMPGMGMPGMGMPGMGGMGMQGMGGGDPRSNPSNPFGSRPMIMGRPSIRTFANSQTLPSIGGNRGGRNTGTSTTTADKNFQVIPIKHIYAGGIARLFGQQAISTQMFISPGGGMGGGMGGMGMGGMGMGGMGMGGMGMGGMGMGGMGGGMGMGGMGMGGMGGGMMGGGMGGGMMGGGMMGGGMGGGMMGGGMGGGGFGGGFGF